MPSFREKVEAILKARDAGRFAAAMNVAAKAIEHFEKAEEHAEHQSEQLSIQTEILEQILDALQDQTTQTMAAMMALSHSIDDVSDEMRELAATTTVANTVMKKSGSNAVFLGKSWAFWKDRLSLTRSELYTTALTIGTYLSPALLALGSSFAYAAVGGGAVAGAGMASFLFGLGGIISIATPVTNGIDKIKKAQDQLNQTIDQYGAASIQASRANSHLYAVIQNNGGPAVASLLGQVLDLRDAWGKLTQPGQRDFIAMLSEGVGAGQNIAPFAAGLANRIVHSLRSGVTSALRDLTGGEARSVMESLTGIFESSAGHGIRGTVNLIMIFGRVIKAAAPWVKRLAQNYEIFTANLRRKANQQAVNKFLNEAVNHFRAWWGLIKQIARTFFLLIRGSRSQGAGLVVTLTAIVKQFNDWLEMTEDTGKVDRFFQSYINSLKQIVWAMQNPMDALDRYMPAVVAAINQYLPDVMDAIANNLAEHGPKAAAIFLNAFINAGAWAKFLTVAYFAMRFGFFAKLGTWAAGIFIKPFATAFAASFAAQLGIQTAAGGLIANAMTGAGGRAGRFFGRAMIVGIIAGIVEIAPLITKELSKIPLIGGLISRYSGSTQGTGGAWGNLWDDIKGVFSPKEWAKKWGFGGKAAGGMIFPGQARWVGEQGPELAMASTRGTMIQPGNRAMPNIPKGIIDIPDLSSAIRLISNVSVQVDRREIARAVSDQRAYDSARRGQEP